ncbi:hypothetical protein CMV_026734 [Castanea mollissima]|uniref:Pentatricopeptide repeat-containing protein n=1 Tax=Castanea mollissima TaxID=60419 RepID=A0A8J4QJH3_9ROSI|nr:hypothetical protein CMV_026734 [Castanea mollissima]
MTYTFHSDTDPEHDLVCSIEKLSRPVDLDLLAQFQIHGALVDMYGKCGEISSAQKMFDEMPQRNVVTWNSLVSGYLHVRCPGIAVDLFLEMLRVGIAPTPFSVSAVLVGCSQLEAERLGTQDGLESIAYIVVTLAIAYSECGGSLEEFRKICLSVTKWDQISWNAVIAGFSNLGYGEESLKCFFEMRLAGVDVDFFTFTSILKAVGIISALEEGKQVHALVFKSGHAANLYVQNGLVSMYARCGAIDDSKRVFISMDRHDVISWNALLSGCAYHGYGRETVQLFEQMRRTHIKPDNTTFLAVLTACSHAGLQDKGLEYFNLMRNDFFLEPPQMEHYATIVDLFGRAGNLHEAEAFINSMPIEPGLTVYKAILSACQVHGNKEIALRSVKKILELCPNDPATYVLLSNVLETGGYWDDASKVRKLMCDSGVRKTPGYSWI